MAGIYVTRLFDMAPRFVKEKRRPVDLSRFLLDTGFRVRPRAFEGRNVSTSTFLAPVTGDRRREIPPNPNRKPME